jgi:hypothetical protein
MLALLPLFAAASAGSALSALSEKQFCDVMTQQVAQLPGTRLGLATIVRSVADCRTKVVAALYRVDLDTSGAPAYIKQFVVKAHANVCKSDAPGARAFVERGWKYSYSFAFRGATVSNVRLDCRARFTT